LRVAVAKGPSVLLLVRNHERYAALVVESKHGRDTASSRNCVSRSRSARVTGPTVDVAERAALFSSAAVGPPWPTAGRDCA
jgi:hypothetical protein